MTGPENRNSVMRPRPSPPPQESPAGGSFRHELFFSDGELPAAGEQRPRLSAEGSNHIEAMRCLLGPESGIER